MLRDRWIGDYGESGDYVDDKCWDCVDGCRGVDGIAWMGAEGWMGLHGWVQRGEVGLRGWAEARGGIAQAGGEVRCRDCERCCNPSHVAAYAHGCARLRWTR